MEQRGQLDMGKVMGVIMVLVAIIVGALVFSKMHDVTSESVEGLGTTYPYQTLNANLSDNTLTSPDNWENLTEPAVSDYITNAWNASGYLTVTRTDNGDNMENGIWYQRLSVTSIYDEVSSATLAFKWRLIENENLSSIRLAAYLDDGSENTLIWSSDNTENNAWTSQENSVTSVVDAAGTYTLWLRAEINPAQELIGSSIIVGWDDASLSVNAYDKSVGEETAEGIGDVGGVIFTILPIIALVSIVFLLVWAFSKRD